MNRKTRTFAAASLTGIVALSLLAVGALGSGCELVVQLDRSLADAGSQDVVLGVCPICTPLEGGAADADAGATKDALPE